MKKVSIYSIVIFVFILMSFFVFSSFNRTLENSLIGEWKESHWEYKEANQYLLKGLLGLENKTAPSGDVRVHKGEVWTFKPNGKLEIREGAISSKLNWSLKGRGNILEISDGITIEHFDIKKIGDNQIELQFISDIQVKEEAKLIFTQTNRI